MFFKGYEIKTDIGSDLEKLFDEYFYDGDKGGIPDNLFDIGTELIKLNENLEKIINILLDKKEN